MKLIIILFLLPCFCKAQITDTLPDWKSDEHQLTEDEIDSIARMDPGFFKIDTIFFKNAATLNKRKKKKIPQ